MKGKLTTTQTLKATQAVAGGGSGGPTTWSQVLNKPFSTVDTTGGLTIYNNTLGIDTLDTIATIAYVDQQIADIPTPTVNIDNKSIINGQDGLQLNQPFGEWADVIYGWKPDFEYNGSAWVHTLTQDEKNYCSNELIPALLHDFRLPIFTWSFGNYGEYTDYTVTQDETTVTISLDAYHSLEISVDDMTATGFAPIDFTMLIQEDSVTLEQYNIEAGEIGTEQKIHQISKTYIPDPEWDDIQNKPTFATVATSGDYDDLLNKPTIPTISATAGLTTGVTVGTITINGDTTTFYAPQGGSGASNWSEVADKPFETVNTSTGLTITSGTLSADQSVLATKSDIPDVSDFITANALTPYAEISSLTPVAFSGDYNDLSNKPSIPTVPTNVSAFTNDSGYITDSALTPYVEASSLTTVAYSGDYDDLINKPTIPPATSVTVTQTLSSGTEIGQIDVDGTTTVLYAPSGGGGSTAWADITGKPAIASSSGTNSIVEGLIPGGTYQNVASGDYAHAEGYRTVASGNYSHTEGYGTVAGTNQHVQGKNNVSSNLYADIVGNGVDENNESNAEATDWNGNKYLAGDVYTHVTDWANPITNSIKLEPVSIANAITTGVAIADVEIGGVTTTLYAPAGGGTAVTPNWTAASGTDGYIDNKPNVYAGKDNTSVIISNTNATDYVSAATYSLVIGQKVGTGTGKGALDALDSGLVIGRKYGNYGGWIGAYHSALAIAEVDSASSAAYDTVQAYYGSIAIKGQKGANAYGKKTAVNAKNGSFAAGVATNNGTVKAQDGSIAFGQAGTAANGSNATEIHAEKYSLAGGRALYVGNTSRNGVYAGYNPETSSTITNGGAFSFGINTRAYKDASSALGYGTEAQSESQTALGKYNVVDSASTYNFIVGNGTAHATRSNSFAAGADGNIYAAGSLYANVSDWSNPTTSGTKMAVIPEPPTTDGTYTLQATVSSGVVTYSWI